MQLNHQMTHNRGDILHNKAFSTQASSDDTLWQFSVIKYPFQWKLLSWWYPVSQKRMNVPKRKMDVILELSYSNFLCESRRLNQLMRDKILLCMGNFLAGVVYLELNAYMRWRSWHFREESLCQSWTRFFGVHPWHGGDFYFIIGQFANWCTIDQGFQVTTIFFETLSESTYFIHFFGT